MTRILEYQITEQFHNMSIGNFLKTLGFSRQCVIALKKQEKGILLNGIWTYVNTLLSEGDTLTLTLSEDESSEKIRKNKAEGSSNKINQNSKPEIFKNYT